MRNRKPIESPKAPPGATLEGFVWFPTYPQAEDIMNRSKRVRVDIENPNVRINAPELGERPPISLINQDDSTGEADPFSLTQEDFEALGPKDLSLDMGDDEQLKHRSSPVDFSAGDLDVPGTELDDAAEVIGSEDEENNSYSLGGDNHNDLEEGRQ